MKMQCEPLKVLSRVVCEYDWEQRPVPVIPLPVKESISGTVVKGYADKLMERTHVPTKLDRILDMIAETVAPETYRDFYVCCSETRAVVWHAPDQEYMADMRRLRNWLLSKQ